MGGSEICRGEGSNGHVVSDLGKGSLVTVIVSKLLSLAGR